MTNNENIIVNKSKKFAIRIVRAYQYLKENKNEYSIKRGKRNRILA